MKISPMKISTMKISTIRINMSLVKKKSGFVGLVLLYLMNDIQNYLNAPSKKSTTHLTLACTMHPFIIVNDRN